jgi:hypothetical protein
MTFSRYFGAGRAALIGVFLHATAALLAQGQPVVDKKNQFPPYVLPDPTPYSATIRSENIKKWVDTLASTTMFGRETGETGQRLAAAFIAAQFKEMGLPPIGDRRTYEQHYKLEKTSWKDLAVKVGNTEYKNREDFYVFHTFCADTPMIQFREVVFVGYGIQEGAYDHYKGADVKGKAVLFYSGEPINAEGKTLLGKDGNRTSWSLDWKRKVELAKANGASLAIIVDTRFKENLRINSRLISTRGWAAAESGTVKKSDEMIQHLFITPELAEALLGKKSEKVEAALASLNEKGAFKPVKVKTELEMRLDKERTTLEGSNVLAFIEGSDPILKDEYIFVTAHYDHLGGVDETIYFGADDNASGTSGVMEIARAFVQAKKNGAGSKRSVVCMLVSGEEKGLLGSGFYTDFPIFPLKKTVANVNIDMIGRVDKLHADNPEYIYSIGSDRLSSELKGIVERNNEQYTQLALDYKYDAPDDPNHYYERSDHYNFAQNGIPVVFFFNGTHDDYHRPTDTADKINFEMLEKRAKLAFYTAWDLANRPYRLNLDRK